MGYPTIRRGSVVRLALLAVLWGSSFMWIKVGLRGFTPMQVVFLRVSLAAGLLLLICWIRGLRLPRKPVVWVHFAVAATVGNVVPFFLFGVGERSVDSGLAGILNATTPLWTIVVAWLARTERVMLAPRAAGLLLGFAGILVIFAPWRSGGTGTVSGAATCLTAAALYGVLFVYVGRFLTGRGLAPTVLSAGQLTAATVLSALALPVGWHAPHLRPDAVGSVAVLGLLGTGVAYILNYRLITDDGPTVASTVTYLIPVVALLFGVALLGEPLSLRVLGGMAVVLASVGLVGRSAGRPPDLAAAAPKPVGVVVSDDGSAARPEHSVSDPPPR
ncbi:MAG: DMT family transporter [Pseudonocardiaceae bacterium]